MKLYSKAELLKDINENNDDDMFLVTYEIFDPSYINSIIKQVRNYLSEREYSKQVSDWTILNIWCEFYHYYGRDLHNSSIIEMISHKILIGG